MVANIHDPMERRRGWRARVVALMFLVVLVGGGSQALINICIAHAEASQQKFPAYTLQSKLLDGDPAPVRACPLPKKSFSSALTNNIAVSHNSFVVHCNEVMEKQRR